MQDRVNLAQFPALPLQRFRLLGEVAGHASPPALLPGSTSAFFIHSFKVWAAIYSATNTPPS